MDKFYIILNFVINLITFTFNNAKLYKLDIIYLYFNVYLINKKIEI